MRRILTATKFDNQDISKPISQTFKEQNPGILFGIGTPRARNGTQNSLLRVLRSLGLPIYGISNHDYPSEWARDLFVEHDGRYVQKTLVEHRGAVFVLGEGGFETHYDSTILIRAIQRSTAETNGFGEIVKQHLGFERVVWFGSHPAPVHLDLHVSILGQTILIQSEYIYSVNAERLRQQGFEVIKIDGRKYVLNFSIFEINGENIAVIYAESPEILKSVLMANRIRVIETAILPESLGIHGAGLRCATNWVGNPAILDFFGISYQTIQ